MYLDDTELQVSIMVLETISTTLSPYYKFYLLYIYPYSLFTLACQNLFPLVAQISDASFKEESKQISETLKKVKAKAALARVGSIPLAELAKLKAYILDSDSEG